LPTLAPESPAGVLSSPSPRIVERDQNGSYRDHLRGGKRKRMNSKGTRANSEEAPLLALLNARCWQSFCNRGTPRVLSLSFALSLARSFFPSNWHARGVVYRQRGRSAILNVPVGYPRGEKKRAGIGCFWESRKKEWLASLPLARTKKKTQPRPPLHRFRIISLLLLHSTMRARPRGTPF